MGWRSLPRERARLVALLTLLLRRSRHGWEQYPRRLFPYSGAKPKPHSRQGRVARFRLSCSCALLVASLRACSIWHSLPHNVVADVVGRNTVLHIRHGRGACACSYRSCFSLAVRAVLYTPLHWREQNVVNLESFGRNGAAHCLQVCVWMRLRLLSVIDTAYCTTNRAGFIHAKGFSLIVLALWHSLQRVR